MNKVAFITGASRGIGRETALAFARAGFDVAISARTLEEGETHAHALTHADGRALAGSLAATAQAVRALGREAFGRVAIEAFAHGVPVLGSDLGGIAETVADDHNGFLFPPGDVAALAALIDRVAGDGALYERLSRGALASAEPYYRPHVAAAYTRFLTSAIDHAAARLERGREQVAS